MDMQLYKRVQEVIDSLSVLEEKQNQKLDQILVQLAEIKQLLKVTDKNDKKNEVKAQELSKIKAKK